MQNRKRDTDVQNRLLESVGEGEGGIFWENSIETSMLSRMKQITSPGWMHETSAQGWCTGKTQRDGMGREAVVGIGMGNTCKSMADSCQCMVKPPQYCKVISFQLVKINEKNIYIKRIPFSSVRWSSRKDLYELPSLFQLQMGLALRPSQRDPLQDTECQGSVLEMPLYVGGKEMCPRRTGSWSWQWGNYWTVNWREGLWPRSGPGAQGAVQEQTASLTPLRPWPLKWFSKFHGLQLPENCLKTPRTEG